ncbi:uncharacterized protein LOC131185107 isoform X2 [Ahaetulla prasina]|uniref:uncharacterized protein LOC131185107 isoform X2 n=1 Tax=Ahaetulla prasina TaxID=499056 RepID=UPI002649B5B8|nr:uncharacterized protein LOC131185107 isoform X2 [Ahaetulla prasina]
MGSFYPIGGHCRQFGKRHFLRRLSGKPQNAIQALGCVESCVVWAHRAGSMAAGLLGGLGSERRLVRSVAHRLKYYIEVQRKENSFQSSGLTWDEAENFYLHPVYLTEQRTKEHNFAKIKLEAFLRAYIGNAEECNRKIQGNLAKQKEDYVPDRINEVKMKSRTRQNKMSCSLSKLYLNAIPPLSPEEVKRLVSSASKLIVAATSKMSPEEMEKTQECKRRETKSVKSFSDGRKKDFSTILFHENQAKRGQRTRQSDKEIKRKAKASSITPAKSKRISSVAAWNTPQKAFVPSLKGADNVGVHSYTPFKIRRQESSSKPGEGVSGKKCPPRKPLAARPSQTLGSKAHEDRPQRSVILKTEEQKVSQGNGYRPSARLTAEICSSQHSTTGKKTRKQFSSEMISRSSILKRVSDPKSHHPNDPRGKFVKCSQRNGPKGERESSDSLPRTASKCHQVNFANWESLGLERDRVRGSHGDGDGDAAATAPSIEKCGLTEGHNGDCVSTVQQGPPFPHELGQEMTREVPPDRTRSESDQSFSSKEPRDARAGGDHVDSLPSRERVLESKSCKRGAICIPPTAPAGCCCSELPSYCVCEIKEGHEIGFPGKTAALLKSLAGEQSDKEFANSSLSSSARSFGWFGEQMGENITLMKEGINPKMETFLQKLLKAPENGTIPQEASHQYEKQK